MQSSVIELEPHGIDLHKMEEIYTKGLDLEREIFNNLKGIEQRCE
jgi:hypothetical protein